ncbi:class I SAM-dependent methyltransferase [Sphingomonas sp. GlSt437]|uniref:class I SAM-dependent methyltransferase n=1 Tax=Sphingomonas sp. GlSt437 TaxID=3389970 RepID=UPI003A8AF019
MRRAVFLGSAALALAAPMVLTAKPAPAPDFHAAVSAPGRSDEATKLDEGRKPEQVLAFEGLKTGDKAADIMAGNGYYTQIIARAVGPRGHVTAYNPEQFVKGDAKATADWAALMKQEHNVSYTIHPFEAFKAPAGAYDFVMIHLDYHDLYWESTKYGIKRIEPASFLKTLYAAVKPGGTVAVIDHVAAPGDTRATVEKYHRIDPETVKADFKAAGFVLDGSSDLLRNTTDDHTKLVFDPTVRGKTDRFVFRFRKPRG